MGLVIIIIILMIIIYININKMNKKDFKNIRARSIIRNHSIDSILSGYKNDMNQYILSVIIILIIIKITIDEVKYNEEEGILVWGILIINIIIFYILLSSTMLLLIISSMLCQKWKSKLFNKSLLGKLKLVMNVFPIIIKNYLPQIIEYIHYYLYKTYDLGTEIILLIIMVIILMITIKISVISLGKLKKK